MPTATTMKTTVDMRKFRKTMNWLRAARERRGGGVPSSGRNTWLGDFGTIGALPCAGWRPKRLSGVSFIVFEPILPVD